VLASGCIKDAAKTLGELQGVRSEINKKFGEDVNVHLGTGETLTLTITFINSKLNDKTQSERGQRAIETAQLVKANYPRIQSVAEIWVVFLRQKSYFFVFHTSDAFEVYGFDKNGQRLSLPSGPGVKQRAPTFGTGFRYLPGTNESEVSADGLQLEGEPGGNNGLVVLVHFKVSGNVQVQKANPPAKVSFDIASYSDKEEFEQVTPIEFSADGRTVLKTEGKFESGNTQFCYLTVAYSDFRKLLTAQQVTIKLGAKEYPLTPVQIGELRKMDSVVKQ
jgi:hypothetical protein